MSGRHNVYVYIEEPQDGPGLQVMPAEDVIFDNQGGKGIGIEVLDALRVTIDGHEVASGRAVQDGLDPERLPMDLDHIELILDLACGYCEGRLSILRNGHLLTPQEGGPPPEYEECDAEIHEEGRAEEVLQRLTALGAAPPSKPVIGEVDQSTSGGVGEK